MPIKFLANHNTIIYGQTGAGKTHFILNVIQQKLVYPFPKNIYYMYKIRQPFMDELNNITFIEGLDFDAIDTSSSSLLVVDDLILSTNKDVAEMFILGSHHKKISIFFLTQNLFPNCDLFRLMSANCHYFVIFQNQRNFRQVMTLARQIFVGRDVKRITEAYKRASNTERGFIVLTRSLPR
jgi:hypothetical protein